MKRGICKEPRYTHRSPRIKRLSRETIREQLARMIHDARRADGRERERDLTGFEGGESVEKGVRVGKRGSKKGGHRRKRLPTVYTYIMQMVPIISEVYNRSINLLTGKKGFRGSTGARSRVGGGSTPPTPPPPPPLPPLLPTSTTSSAPTNAEPHTTIDKCILLAYHLYAWGFAFSLSLSLPPVTLLCSPAFSRLGYRPLRTDI